MENNQYLMRSLMFVPAHNKKLMDSASRRDADVLLLDLEDSVPSNSKQDARNNVISYINNNAFPGKLIFPRINDRESGELLKDLLQLTIQGVDGFLYPKATKPEDIYFIGKLLETIETEKKIPVGTFKIIPLIETTGAVINISKICEACTRVVAVAFGCEDYVTDLQGKHDQDGISILNVRANIAIAARAAGIFPIDTVHIKVHDLEDLEMNLQLSRNLGFEGMLVLNPIELPLVNRYYSPTNDEVLWAEEILNLSEEAAKDGQGVAIKNGKFIGPPMVKMAKNILRKQALIAHKSQNNETE